MRNINIYTNIPHHDFIIQLFPLNNLNLKTINDLFKNDHNDEGGVIIFNGKLNPNINVNNLKKKYILISNDTKVKKSAQFSG